MANKKNVKKVKPFSRLPTDVGERLLGELFRLFVALIPEEGWRTMVLGATQAVMIEGTWKCLARCKEELWLVAMETGMVDATVRRSTKENVVISTGEEEKIYQQKNGSLCVQWTQSKKQTMVPLRKLHVVCLLSSMSLHLWT